MNINKYKILFYISIVFNIILIAFLFKPIPKEEQEVLKFFREAKKSQTSILSESLSDEIKYTSNRMIIKLSENWDLEVLKSLFTEKVLNQIGVDKLPQLLKMFSRLGKFEEQLLPVSVETIPSQPNTILYAANIKFSNGKGYVKLVLEKINDQWYLNRININSEVFLK